MLHTRSEVIQRRTRIRVPLIESERNFSQKWYARTEGATTQRTNGNSRVRSTGSWLNENTVQIRRNEIQVLFQGPVVNVVRAILQRDEGRRSCRRARAVIGSDRCGVRVIQAVKYTDQNYILRAAISGESRSLCLLRRRKLGSVPSSCQSTFSGSSERS